MGFTGKQAIHPNQLDIIQRVFSPNKDELDRALRIIQGNKIYSIIYA